LLTNRPSCKRSQRDGTTGRFTSGVSTGEGAGTARVLASMEAVTKEADDREYK